jgi:magnesium chelatase family protein
MYGPAGTGKTMLAKALVGILPPLTYDQMLESSAIHSYVGLLDSSHLTAPPYRAPHHTSSYSSVIGGGTYPRPGEISLAHNGVLFMDEFPEFDKRVLESLREPMEDQEVRISRSKGTVTFPAQFTLVAALNPPSAIYRDNTTITPAQIRAFSRKISGPIMDRIDIWVEVPKIEHTKLLGHKRSGQTSEVVQKQVMNTRAHQYHRLGEGKTNARMSVRDLDTHISLDPHVKQLLDTSASSLNLSPRVYHKIIKLAQTIADMESSPRISQQHILEALQYRPRDII